MKSSCFRATQNNTLMADGAFREPLFPRKAMVAKGIIGQSIFHMLMSRCVDASRPLGRWDKLPCVVSSNLFLIHRRPRRDKAISKPRVRLCREIVCFGVGLPC